MDEGHVLSLDAIIQHRRSIRKYKPDIPPDGYIELMIQVAACAPSPSNIQPVRFVEIISEKLKESLHRAILSGREHFLKCAKGCDGPKRLKNIINTYFRYSEWMFNAPRIFAVGVSRSASGFSKKLFESGLMKKYEPKDLDITLGLALKGFILKGEELGLGSCILTAPLVFIPNVEGLLGVEDLYIRCLVTVGFPDEVPGPIDRKRISEIYSKI